MNKLLLLVMSLLFVVFVFSQEKDKAYYLRKFHMFTPSGKVNYYELMYFSGNEVILTTINVLGQIGNPITTAFFIDTCHQQLGKIDSLNSGYIIRDDQKRVFKIRKMNARKLRVDFNGFYATYKRIPETVNFVTKLKSICSCY